MATLKSKQERGKKMEQSIWCGSGSNMRLMLGIFQEAYSLNKKKKTFRTISLISIYVKPSIDQNLIK